MEKKYSDRRFKIISFDQQFLVDLFNWWRNPPHLLALPITDELPADCEVVSVSVSWERGCVEAIVHSKEFRPGIPGEEIERLAGWFTDLRTVKISKQEG
ncbi:hypothetical protein ER57_07910 [Smithella sp. SCADC]|nr:hypothetical protein ER57_07910 [Smithella sp. SCADC]